MIGNMRSNPSVLGAARRFPGLRVVAAQHHGPEVARYSSILQLQLRGLNIVVFVPSRAVALAQLAPYVQVNLLAQQ